MTARFFIEREGQTIIPGSGGRHRRYREPGIVTLAGRAVWAQLRGIRR